MADYNVFVVDGKFYSVPKDFVHPGGSAVLERHAGEDITTLFRGEKGHVHSPGAKRLLESFKVGSPESKSSSEDALDFSKPLLSQVGTLGGDAYQEWISRPRTGHPRLLGNAVLESCTCTYWWIVPLFWVPIALYCSAQVLLADPGVMRSQLVSLYMMVNGVVLWQFLEYLVHRYAFHFEPQQPLTIILHFLLHGHHHKYPLDPYRLVFPVPVAALAMSLLHWSCHVLLPKALAAPLFAGGLWGYLMYDMTHFGVHHFSSFAVWMKPLRLHHMEHHFGRSDMNYGISSSLFDSVFSSTSVPASVQKLK